MSMGEPMIIGGQHIGGHRMFTIAELGNNHGGSVETAHKMVDAAADAGADSCKLQIRHNRTLYTPAFYDRTYESPASFGATYGAHREALELPVADLAKLKRHADDIGMTLFATAFDEWAVDACVNLDFPAIKIASGCLTDTPLIAYAAKTGLPLIISTGGATETDIERGYVAAGGKCAILQCTASYPAAYEELDLGVLPEWSEGYSVPVGVSLHDSGIAMAVASYVLGARIIEMHFTLNRASRGTDHGFSLEPQGFKKLVRDLRRVEVALGSTKRQHASETEPLRKMAKSLYPVRPLSRGHRIALEDICRRSPASPSGLAPYLLDELVGVRLDMDLSVDDPFPATLLEGQA